MRIAEKAVEIYKEKTCGKNGEGCTFMDLCEKCLQEAVDEAVRDLLTSAAQWLHVTAPLHARAPEIRELADKIYAEIKK